MKKFKVGDKFEVVGIFSGRPAFHEITKIENGEITTTERWVSEDTWENCEATNTFKIEIDKAENAERIEVWEYRGEHGYVWATNEDKKEESNMTMFTLNGFEYKTNEKGNYYYKSTGNFDKKGNPVMMRIAKHVWEQAFDEYVNTTNMDDDWDIADEIEDRKQKEIEDAKQAEQEFNGKKEEPKAKTKKAAKPRKSKDIAHESNGVTLTAKQVDFIKHIPDTCFYENGLESTMWCDCLADEIGGQFAGKPMTVGAMISTLREKNVIYVQVEKVNGKKAKYFGFTDFGKQVAQELGLN